MAWLSESDQARAPSCIDTIRLDVFARHGPSNRYTNSSTATKWASIDVATIADGVVSSSSSSLRRPPRSSSSSEEEGEEEEKKVSSAEKKEGLGRVGGDSPVGPWRQCYAVDNEDIGCVPPSTIGVDGCSSNNSGDGTWHSRITLTSTMANGYDDEDGHENKGPPPHELVVRTWMWKQERNETCCAAFVVLGLASSGARAFRLVHHDGEGARTDGRTEGENSLSASPTPSSPPLSSSSSSPASSSTSSSSGDEGPHRHDGAPQRGHHNKAAVAPSLMLSFMSMAQS